MTTFVQYRPCKRCQAKLVESKIKSNESFNKHKSFFKSFAADGKFYLGAHGIEKAQLKDIDMNLPEEILLAQTGRVIEIQTGKNEGEIKFIVHNFRNKEPLHYIFLKEPHSDFPTLINVYNPTEGMSFKWSPDGKRRLFLNSFRSCCKHPLDSKENYNKKHHGVQHESYKYQSEDSI